MTRRVFRHRRPGHKRYVAYASTISCMVSCVVFSFMFIRSHRARKPPRDGTPEHDPSVFYFAISHPTSIRQELAARETWAHDISITWYNTVPTLPHTVVLSADPNTYENILERVLKVWEHVHREHSGYEWYVRLWPDNYVFCERLENLLKLYSPKAPQLIGRVGHVDFGTEKQTDFVTGGSGWALSGSALEAWAAHHDFRGCKSRKTTMISAEDWIISLCLLDAGVRIIDRSDVFKSHPSARGPIENYTISDAAIGTPVQIVTLHYMSATQIITMWAKERRVNGYWPQSIWIRFKLGFLNWVYKQA